MTGIKKPVHWTGFYLCCIPRHCILTLDLKWTGAGEGNRTLVISLGSWSNAIIRHPLERLTLYQM